jgi:malate synthase
VAPLRRTSVDIRSDPGPRGPDVLTAEAVALVERLHRTFEGRRRELLERRRARRAELRAGALPGFREETARVRLDDWRVPPAPPGLQDRRVEITGPVDRKMMINALNSGARAFMADFEDSLAPTWRAVVDGQANVMDAVCRTIRLETVGRRYGLVERPATLLIRPRGWHLIERHVHVDGAPVSAGLFDFGLWIALNGAELLGRGSGPYLYLPKLESHLEARLWRDVFAFAEAELGLPQGSVRATVLIETLPAAFEMDEILFQLGEHATGLNAGRWDYIFSLIKNLGHRPEFLLPDRAAVTMTAPFMRAYTRLLVATCHRRGAHAVGGMAAFVPSRSDPSGNERAIAAVREDKVREAGDGFDGTWVAHPGLVPVAGEAFDAVLGERPNQLDRIPEPIPSERELLDARIPGSAITEAGLRGNVEVAVRYLAAWLGGSGAVAIDGLMEDAATAEIARSQVWQWIRHRVATEVGPITLERVRAILDEVEERRRAEQDGSPLAAARELFESVALTDELVEFLTIPAYQWLT